VGVLTDAKCCMLQVLVFLAQFGILEKQLVDCFCVERSGLSSNLRKDLKAGVHFMVTRVVSCC